MSRFEDILEPRRNEPSNFMWASREMEVALCCKQNASSTPETHKMEVLNSERIQGVMRKLSGERNVAPEVIERQVRAILDEIGFNKKLTLLRWLAIVLSKIACKVCTGIYVNHSALYRLQSQMGKTPVIYVPNHKSYADFILMSYVLFDADISIPAIAAGMDFYSMRGMGTVLRNTGAFFMRRSYNKDELYWDTFREYVNNLVVGGHSGVEFFIEGMRSRSCKALPPKYGLLFMILKSYFTGEVPDILFAPISISYERMLEEKLFAFELLGIPKPKETTSGFFKSMSILSENYGKIYFDFAKPISTREFFAGHKLQTSVKPVYMHDLAAEDKRQIVRLAEHIVTCQKGLTIVTASNLIAMILSEERHGIELKELIGEVVRLQHFFEEIGVNTSVVNPRDDVDAALMVHRNLFRSGDSRVSLADDFKLGDFNRDRLKGHDLKDETIVFAVPYIMLQIYVNPAFQFAVSHAFLVSIIGRSNFGRSDVLEQYKFLCTIFSNEFTIFHCDEKFTSTLEHLLYLKCVEQTEDLYASGPNVRLTRLLVNLLEPFLLNYYMMCVVINEGDRLDERSMVAACQEQIERLIEEETDFIHPYALSLDSMSLCLQRLVGLKVLSKYNLNGMVMYSVDLEELSSIRIRLEQFVKPHTYSNITGATLQLKTKL